MRHSPTDGIDESSFYDNTQFRNHRHQHQAKEANIPPSSSTSSPSPPSHNGNNNNMSHYSNNDNGNNGGVADGEEALLDLAQLEELHQEAERMKALGNKHMAAQVGPSNEYYVEIRKLCVLYERESL